MDNLLVNNLTINELEIPFSNQEIDNMIAELPNNKSSGQDGFNNEFIKGCWSLLSTDYYKLFETLYEGEICLRSINSSHIALIPKKMA